MAASLTPESSDISGYITECSKCHQLLNNPRSLPCLHSYCATCLESDIEKEPKKTQFSCLICREEFDIPAGGVKEWRSLSIVHKLTEQEAMQVKLMTKDSLRCTSCPEPVSKHDTTDEKCGPPIAVARCTECEDYLCQRCVSVHKSVRILRNHPVYTLEELRAGKKVSELDQYEQRSCLKHKGEVLMFYCETCDVPICRQCVVIAHRHPEHQQCELEQAATGKSEILRELQEACKTKKAIFDKDIIDIRASKRNLNDAIAEARCKISDTVEKFKASYLSRLDTAKKKAEGELNDLYSKTSENLESTERKLMSANSKVSTSMAVTEELLDKGTDYEIASDFANLRCVMNKLNDMNHSTDTQLIKGIDKIKFSANKQSEEEISFGQVSGIAYQRTVRATRVSTLKSEFGHDGQGPVKLALDVVMMASGNYALTDHSAANVKLYNPTGVYKSSFNVNAGVDAGKKSNPWCIKIGPDNLFYVTDYSSPFVKIFDLEGTYKRHFGTVSPDNIAYSSHGSSNVCGLAFNSKQQVLAGNTTHNFISRHALDGTHVSSVKVQISPWFLAVTSNDHVVVSTYGSINSVHIIDETGQILTKLETPTGLSSIQPAGVVTSTKYKANDDEDEIFVVDRGNGHCVHRYSGTGKFINTVTTDVSDVYGIALSANEQQMVVACTSRVKCFDI